MVPVKTPVTRIWTEWYRDWEMLLLFVIILKRSLFDEFALVVKRGEELRGGLMVAKFLVG